MFGRDDSQHSQGTQPPVSDQNSDISLGDSTPPAPTNNAGTDIIHPDEPSAPSLPSVADQMLSTPSEPASSSVSPSSSFTPASPAADEPPAFTPNPAADSFGDSPADAPVPAITTTHNPSPSPVAPVTPVATDSDDLLSIKQHALQELSPLVSHLEQSPEEKFRTTMMMIQASDDSSLIKQAHEAALQIKDEKVRAQALLDIVNEINYFTQQHSAQG